jgi:hypothetical protein
VVLVGQSGEDRALDIGCCRGIIRRGLCRALVQRVLEEQTCHSSVRVLLGGTEDEDVGEVGEEVRVVAELFQALWKQSDPRLIGRTKENKVSIASVPRPNFRAAQPWYMRVD